MGNVYGCNCLRKEKDANEFNTNHKEILLNDTVKKVPSEKTMSDSTDVTRARSNIKSPSIKADDNKNEMKEVETKDVPPLDKRVQEMISKLEPFQLTEKEKAALEEMDLVKKGPVIIDNNMAYTGTWNKKGEKEGFGEIIFFDGGKFEGFFKNDMMNGRGRLINSQGVYYEGEFLNDKANNFGKYISGEGVEYVGYWKDDKQHGKGEETYTDGSKYVGYFENGEKSGKGFFSWVDGSTFEGEFVRNTINGRGIYRWKDGRIYQGDWVNNKMEGVGVFVWPDKKKYVGQYKEDKKSGYGVFVWPDGKKYEGFWYNGKQNGYGIMTAKGQKKIGEWKNGKKTRWVDETPENSALIDRILKKIHEASLILKNNETLSVSFYDEK